MTPDLNRKLAILADAAKYDVSCASSGSERASSRNGIGATTRCGVCHSWTPDGRCVALLKVLLTNYCVYDCHYCINRRSSDVPRVRFTPEEVCFLTMEFYRRNYIEGLFLSSGVLRSPDYTMEQLVRVASLLRQQDFGGYIHLKAVPGASQELLDAAGLLADRLSANIELPTQKDLSVLAPEKKTNVIECAMQEIHVKEEESKQAARSKTVSRPPRFAPAGQSTQMVIGATPTPDQSILQTASTLYHKYSLRRVYYSAYSPVPQALAEVKPVIFVGVPRVYEKIRQQVILKTTDFPKRALYQWALQVGRKHREEILSGGQPGALSWKIANRLLFSKVRAGMGGKAEEFISGGAPLGRELAEWYADIGVCIHEGYGLTETSPVIAVNNPRAHKLGTVGKPLSNVEVKIADDGEVLMFAWMNRESLARTLDTLPLD